MTTLRSRILLYLGLAVLVSTILTVVVAGFLVRGHVERQALANLERQADAAATVGGGTRVLFARGGRPRPAGPRIRDAIASTLPAGDRSGRVKLGDRELLYAARETGEGRIVLVRRAKLATADWRPFLSSLILAGLGGALVAVALSALLARRLTRPLRDLAEATELVAAGQAGVRVPVDGRDELARLGSSFNAMADQLGAARATEREFLMSVSHELKTPLTAIRGYAEGLADGAVDPEEAGTVIVAEAQRLERLVADLLDLARLDRRAFAVAREPVDLAAVARRAQQREAVRASELGVELAVAHDGDAWALGDEGRLLQAVSNLVDNALRVTAPGGRVIIAARPGALAVSDTGPGLAPEDLPRAFDRFYLHARARARAGASDGAGLGLAIVRELAGAMGGSASVASRPGEGATFTVHVPRLGAFDLEASPTAA
ncbi:MAG: sensor histidine kinase [Solirubrobacteraceae bacterium]